MSTLLYLPLCLQSTKFSAKILCFQLSTPNFPHLAVAAAAASTTNSTGTDAASSDARRDLAAAAAAASTTNSTDTGTPATTTMTSLAGPASNPSSSLAGPATMNRTPGTPAAASYRSSGLKDVSNQGTTKNNPTPANDDGSHGPKPSKSNGQTNRSSSTAAATSNPPSGLKEGSNQDTKSFPFGCANFVKDGNNSYPTQFLLMGTGQVRRFELEEGFLLKEISLFSDSGSRSSQKFQWDDDGAQAIVLSVHNHEANSNCEAVVFHFGMYFEKYPQPTTEVKVVDREKFVYCFEACAAKFDRQMEGTVELCGVVRKDKFGGKEFAAGSDTFTLSYLKHEERV